MDREQRDILAGLPASIPGYGLFVRGETKKLSGRGLTTKEFDGMTVITLPDGNEQIYPIRLTLLVYPLEKEPIGTWEECLMATFGAGRAGEGRMLTSGLVPHGDDYIKVLLRCPT